MGKKKGEKKRINERVQGKALGDGWIGKDLLSAGDEVCFIGLVHKHDNHLQEDPGYGHDSTASVKRRHIGPNPVERQTRRCCFSGKLAPPIQHLQGQPGHKLQDHHGTPSASQKSIRSPPRGGNIRGREAKDSIRCVAKRWRAPMGLIANEPRTARQPNKAGGAA